MWQSLVAFNLPVLLLRQQKCYITLVYICIHDLPDINALIPWAFGPLGFKHTYQANPSCPCCNHYLTYLCNTFTPQIKGIFPLPRVHLKVDQRVQRNNFPGIHLNVHRCTSGCIPGKLFLWTLWSILWSENWNLSWRLCIFIVKHKTFDCGIKNAIVF